MSMIRLLLANASPMLNKMVSAAIESTPDILLVAHVVRGQDIPLACDAFRPDIILLDASLPDMSGVEIVRLISNMYPGIKVVGFSSTARVAEVRNMLVAGAVGYVLATTSLHDLALTLRTACNGKAVFSPDITGQLLAVQQPEQQTVD
jgi:DNA-binding NarL/FixJ family response regulator